METYVMEKMSIKELEQKRKALSKQINQMLSSMTPNGNMVKQSLDTVWEIIHEIERRKIMVS